MNLIEKLGLEKCKQIVVGSNGGHDETHYCTEGDSYTDGFDEYEECENCISINDIRTAIVNHERTDTCSDIANHISPRTTVIER